MNFWVKTGQLKMGKAKRTNRQTNKTQSPRGVNPNQRELPEIGPVGFPDHWIYAISPDGAPWMIDLLRRNGLTRADKRVVPKRPLSVQEILSNLYPDFATLNDIDKRVIAYSFTATEERLSQVINDCSCSFLDSDETIDHINSSSPEVAILREWAPVLSKIPPRNFTKDTNPLAKYLVAQTAGLDEAIARNKPIEGVTLLKELQGVFYELWSRLDVQLKEPLFYDEDATPIDAQLVVIDRLFALAMAIDGVSCMRVFFEMYPQIEDFFEAMLELSDLPEHADDDRFQLRKSSPSKTSASARNLLAHATPLEPHMAVEICKVADALQV